MAEDKKSNEIIRVERVPNGYATMDKRFLEDDRLSFKAKGILAYLLSKPNNWKVIVWDLVQHCKDGKTSVYAGLKELKECGYYKKVPVRSEDGTRIVRWESTVYEVPNLEALADEEVPEQEEASALEQVVTKIKKKITKTEQLITKVTEKATKTEQKQSKSSLVPDFQEQQEENLEKWERNRNYYNKNYSSKNYSSPSQTNHQTEREHIFRVLDFVKRKINYANFELAHKEDMSLVDEFVNVVLDAVLSTGGTVRINGVDKPRELVRSQLMKLTYTEFEFVLERFKGLKQKIKKKHQYILSMLYNAKMELNTHYTNWVQSEWGY